MHDDHFTRRTSAPRKRLSAFAQVAWLAVQLVALALLIRLGAVRFFATDNTYKEAASALVFLALAIVLTGYNREAMRVLARRARPLGSGLACALGYWIVIETILLLSAPTRIWTNLLQFFVPAAVEECVFRRILPTEISRLLAPLNSSVGALRVSSSAGASLTFALCHLDWLSPLAAGPSALQNGARLFLIGLLYSLLVAEVGLPLSSGVHTALNVYATNVDVWSNVRPNVGWTIVGVVVAATMLWHEGPHAASATRGSLT